MHMYNVSPSSYSPDFTIFLTKAVPMYTNYPSVLFCL